MQDHAKYERKQWIEHVSPLHLDETRVKIKYLFAKLLNLVFGVSMPHERRYENIN